ncbi:hypothetical protein ACFL56_01755 [Candidatus Margulisiibacteriota bacterium]
MKKIVLIIILLLISSLANALVVTINMDSKVWIDGDYVSRQPTCTVVTDTSPAPEVFINGISQGTMIDAPANPTFNMKFPVLSPGSYTLELVTSGVTQSYTMRVSSKENKIVDKIACVPNPFDPLTETTTIAYVITSAFDGDMIIMKTTGVPVHRREIRKNQPGGYTGINYVIWDGTSDFTNDPVANGLYLGFILDNDKKVIGKFKVIIRKQ